MRTSDRRCRPVSARRRSRRAALCCPIFVALGLPLLRHSARPRLSSDGPRSRARHGAAGGGRFPGQPVRLVEAFVLHRIERLTSRLRRPRCCLDGPGLERPRQNCRHRQHRQHSHRALHRHTSLGCDHFRRRLSGRLWACQPRGFFPQSEILSAPAHSSLADFPLINVHLADSPGTFAPVSWSGRACSVAALQSPRLRPSC